MKLNLQTTHCTGEIMVKRVRYSGYQQQQKSDMATKWVGGWFCTGDIGERIGDHAVKVGE